MRKKAPSLPDYEILHNEQGFWWGFGHPQYDYFERTSDAYFPDEQSCKQAIDEDRRMTNPT